MIEEKKVSILPIKSERNQITSITDAYYKLIMISLRPVCCRLNSNSSSDYLFAISAIILHKYLRFRETLNDIDSLATICSDVNRSLNASSSDVHDHDQDSDHVSDSSKGTESSESTSSKNSVYRVIIMIASLSFLAGKINESLLTIQQCVKVSYEQLYPHSKSKSTTIDPSKVPTNKRQ
jgi:hypothetical protein